MKIHFEASTAGEEICSQQCRIFKNFHFTSTEPNTSKDGDRIKKNKEVKDTKLKNNVLQLKEWDFKCAKVLVVPVGITRVLL